VTRLAGVTKPSAARYALPPEFHEAPDTDAEGPWWSLRGDTAIARALEDQLHEELPRGHILDGLSPVAIARRQDNDDVMFDLSDGRFAIVHLTWSDDPAPDPAWPATTVYATWNDAQQRMTFDQAAFRPG